MAVMKIFAVGVVVFERFVVVNVTMRADDWWVVHVRVMAVVVAVGVLVLHRFMYVQVAVGFGQVQVDAGCEQRARQKEE